MKLHVSNFLLLWLVAFLLCVLTLEMLKVNWLIINTMPCLENAYTYTAQGSNRRSSGLTGSKFHPYLSSLYLWCSYNIWLRRKKLFYYAN